MLWIVGSKGLLGSALCAKCKAALHVPAVETGKELDISNLEALREFVRKAPPVTHIVNCAAFSAVDAAEERKEEAYQTNVIGPENLAIIAKEIKAKLVHISTDYVFSGKGKVPLTEQDPTEPCNYYGQTKLEGERRALLYGASVIRTSWLFGAGGKNFVSKLLKMFQSQKEISLTDDQWGRFTYAPDLAEAILKMLDKEGLYQYANAGIATRYEFGLAMQKEARSLGLQVVTEKILPVRGASFLTTCERPAFSAFDTSKIEQFVQIRPWNEALKEFLCEQTPAYS